MNVITNRRALSCLTVVLACFSSVRVEAGEAAPSHRQLVETGLRASEKEMAWWRDAKFGIAIHWGVGVETRHAPWANKTDPAFWANLSANLAKVKKAGKFDAAKWIKVVKQSGARYVIFSTSHDNSMQRRPGGNFCLWDTKTTDNKITFAKSPFKRDVCKEIADAAHMAGIRLVWAVSGRAGANVKELLTNYGKISGVVYDGVLTDEGVTHEDMLRKMRKLQPGILTNGHIEGNVHAVDYDTVQRDVPFPGWTARPVEVAATLRDGHSYWDKPNPSVKSLEQVVHLLVRCAGRGANLTVNLAPAPSGAIERNEAMRAAEIGVWLKKYGKSVLGTRPGPYLPAEWGVAVHKGKTIYIHMLQDIEEGVLRLGALDKKIVKAKLVTGGDVTFEQTNDAVTLTVPKLSVKTVDTIIALKLAGPASEAKVVRPATNSLTAGKTATAEHVFSWPANGVTKAMNGPLSAVDGKFETGWCSRPATREQSDEPRWLEVDLGAPAEVGTGLVAASRALGASRKTIQAFVVQYKKDGEWVTCFDSKSILGVALKRWTHPITFAPVTARHFRLGVRGRNTFIREFQLFAPGS